MGVTPESGPGTGTVLYMANPAEPANRHGRRSALHGGPVLGQDPQRPQLGFLGPDQRGRAVEGALLGEMGAQFLDRTS